MASRTLGALQRNVESLALSLETATRRAEETVVDEDGAEVPRHPEAAGEVERLTALHADALAALEERLDSAPEAGGPHHERSVNSGVDAGG